MRQPSESWRPLRVEAALGSPSAPPVWQDVSALVKGDDGVSIVRGGRERRSKVSPGRAQFTLDNRDGAFSGALYRRRFRVAYRHPVAANMVDAESAAFEGGTVGRWTAGGTVPPALTNSTVRSWTPGGTRSLLITWGEGGSLPLANLTLSGFVVGRRYLAKARVWVPSGHPNVLLVRGGGGFGASVTVKGEWAEASITFVATASTQALQVWPNGGASAGQQCWVDGVIVDEADLPLLEVKRTNLAPNPRLVGGLSEWGGRVDYIEPQFSRAVLPAAAAPSGGILGAGNSTGVFTRTIEGGRA